MKLKYINLLQHINEQPQWVSSSLLGEKFDLSKRTIKSYISEIQSIAPGVIISSNKGYRVNSDKFRDFLNTKQTNIPETPSERNAYILLKLTSTNEAISIFDLSEDLHISESTILSDLRKIKKQCLKHALEIKQVTDTIQLIGTEKSKRTLIHTTLLSELDNCFVNITKLQESFTNFDLDYLKEIVAEHFSNYEFFTNDFALTNIVIHLAITVDRLKNNFKSPKSNNNSLQSIHSSVVKIANNIATDIAAHYSINFPPEEIYDLTLLIAANGTNVNFTQVALDDLEQIASEWCLTLVKKILEKVYELYFIDSNEPDFFIRFTLHIKNLLYRIDNGFTSRNPMTQTIKSECPLIYDCAVQVSYVIQKELGFLISEDEIAYIAFHLGYALEIQKQRNTKINCTVLVPLYYNMNIQILDKLKRNFSEDLDIQNILTDENELQYVDTDLIISAVKLKQVITMPYVIINPFLTLSDCQHITTKILDIRKTKQKKVFIKNFQPLVHKTRFLYTTSNHSYEELLEIMSDTMLQEGLVHEDFFDQVMVREKISSTAFGKVAIPHSLSMNAKKTGIYIVVNPNGIQWKENKVTLIFLISINYKNRHLFREIFDDLAMICTDEQNVQRLSQLTTLDSFLKVLPECLVSLA